MRKLFYLFLFVALMIAASTNAQNRDWANLKHYSAANAELINAIDGTPRVVFMGNSITEGWVNNHPDFLSLMDTLGEVSAVKPLHSFCCVFVKMLLL